MLLLSASLAYAQENVTVYFFHSNRCPHCAEEKGFLENLEQKYPTLEVRYYETSEPESIELFKKFAGLYGSATQWVPATFICDEYFIGFNEEISKKIENKIIGCMTNECNDLYLLNKTAECEIEKNSTVDVPLLGEIDLSTVGLPMLTVVLGFLDGFNPCAIWVLCFLLSLLLYAQSRKKIILIGSIFVATSGIVYFLFMAAWLNFFLMVGFVDFLRVLIALVAISAGLINMKDFFFFKTGISLTIPKKWQPKLFKRMRKLVRAEAFWTIVIGTVVLAFMANSFELICTFGFPAIYTRALTLHNLSLFEYYLYLALYNVIYVIPLAIIVSVFAYTMGAHRFGEKHGRILKLISGALMLVLGLILLLRPELLMFG